MVYGLSKNYYCISLLDINIIRYIQDYIYTPKMICICLNQKRNFVAAIIQTLKTEPEMLNLIYNIFSTANDGK
jgi:hypothetical protein